MTLANIEAIADVIFLYKTIVVIVIVTITNMG